MELPPPARMSRTFGRFPGAEGPAAGEAAGGDRPPFAVPAYFWKKMLSEFAPRAATVIVPDHMVSTVPSTSSS